MRSELDAGRGGTHDHLGASLPGPGGEQGQKTRPLDHEIGCLQRHIALRASGEEPHDTRAMHDRFGRHEVEDVVDVRRHDPGTLDRVDRRTPLEHQHALAGAGEQLGRAQPRAGRADDERIVASAGEAVVH
jgi:hypothetical protein